MDDSLVKFESLIYRKTTRGTAELAATGSKALSRAARQILILLDGKRSAAELAALLNTNQLGPLLAELETQGFARLVDPNAPSAAAPPPTVYMDLPQIGDVAAPVSRMTAKPEQRRLVPMALLALFSVCAVAGGAYFVMRGSPSSDASSAANTSTAPSAVTPSKITTPANEATAANATPARTAPPPVAPPSASKSETSRVASQDTKPAAATAPAPASRQSPSGAHASATATSREANSPSNASSTSAPAKAAAKSSTSESAGSPNSTASANAPASAAAGPDGADSAKAAPAQPTAAAPTAPVALHARRHDAPTYPARLLHRDPVPQGSVMARILVGADGNVEKVEIVEATPPGVFDNEVQRTLSNWTYDPPGRPVSAMVKLTFKP